MATNAHAVILDVNLQSLDGNPDALSLPVFSYVEDENVTIGLTAVSPLGIVTLDLEYSTSSTFGTGTEFISSLALSSVGTTGPRACQSTNFLTPVSCTFDWNIANVPDGTYYINAQAGVLFLPTDTDTTGNSFKIDNTKPTTSWDGIANNWQNETTFHLTCNDGTGAGCALTQYRVDTDASSVVTYGAWQTYAGSITFPSSGEWAIDFNSSDAAGNKGNVNSVSFLIDTDLPSTEADYETGWNDSEASLSLSCDDETSECDTTLYRLDTDADVEMTFGSWTTYTEPLLFSSDGNWAIEYYSTDVATNEEETSRVFILVDTTFPQVSHDVNEGIWVSAGVLIHASCTDQTSGCQTYYQLDMDPTDEITLESGVLVGEGFMINTDGNWALTFYALDGALNMESTDTTVLVDKTPPSITILHPTPESKQYSSDVTLTYIARDLISGTGRYDVSEDGENWIDNGFNTSYTFEEQNEGTHTYFVRAKDGVGNAKIDQVTIDINYSAGDPNLELAPPSTFSPIFIDNFDDNESYDWNPIYGTGTAEEGALRLTGGWPTIMNITNTVVGNPLLGFDTYALSIEQPNLWVHYKVKIPEADGLKYGSAGFDIFNQGLDSLSGGGYAIELAALGTNGAGMMMGYHDRFNFQFASGSQGLGDGSFTPGEWAAVDMIQDDVETTFFINGKEIGSITSLACTESVYSGLTVYSAFDCLNLNGALIVEYGAAGTLYSSDPEAPGCGDDSRNTYFDDIMISRFA